MVLFKLRVPMGPNILAVAMYPLRDWHTLFFYVGSFRRALTFRLPVRVRWCA